MEQKELETKEQNVKNKRKWQKTFIVNISLLILGIAMSISGLIIQFHYHLLKNNDEAIVFTLNRIEWNTIHVWTSIFFLIVIIYHIGAHRKWYANMIKQNLPAKHRATMILTVLTSIVVISGLIPLFILYLDGNPAMRFSMIEIHDKIAILLFIAVSRHTIKRFKWYINMIKNKPQ